MTITIKSLDERCVTLHTLETAEFNGRTVTVIDEKHSFANCKTGREKVKEFLQEHENIYQAVMLIWGDKPVRREALRFEGDDE